MASTPKFPRWGRIWFIGGPLDNRVEFIKPWHASLAVAMPLGLPHLVPVGEPEPAFESRYTLEKLVAASEQGAAEFIAYVHETVTHAALVERIYLTPEQPECEFCIPDSEIEKSLGVKRKFRPRPKIR